MLFKKWFFCTTNVVKNYKTNMRQISKRLCFYERLLRDWRRSVFFCLGKKRRKRNGRSYNLYLFCTFSEHSEAPPSYFLGNFMLFRPFVERKLIRVQTAAQDASSGKCVFLAILLSYTLFYTPPNTYLFTRSNSNDHSRAHPTSLSKPISTKYE